LLTGKDQVATVFFFLLQEASNKQRQNFAKPFLTPSFVSMRVLIISGNAYRDGPETGSNRVNI
jgi:hypothetical protein